MRFYTVSDLPPNDYFYLGIGQGDSDNSASRLVFYDQGNGNRI